MEWHQRGLGRIAALSIAALLIGNVVALATIGSDAPVVVRSLPRLPVPTSLLPQPTIVPRLTPATTTTTTTAPRPVPPSLRGQILFISRRRADRPQPTTGRVVPSSNGYNVWAMAADGTRARPLTTTSQDAEPALSPDGRYVTWVKSSNQVWVMGSDGSQPAQLAACPFDCQSPRWSPDGTRIAFVSLDALPAHKGDVVTIGADGTGVRHYVTPLVNAYGLDWSPNGAQLVVNVSGPEATAGMWIMNVESGAVHRIHTGFAIAPAWSPNGALIAFSDGSHLLAVTPTGAGLHQISKGTTGQYLAGHWSRDGRQIVFDYFPGIEGVLEKVALMNADGSGERFLTDGVDEAYESTF
jgi:Tol biopolymer transport system component